LQGRKILYRPFKQAALEFSFQIIKNGAQMDVRYQQGNLCVVPVKYHRDLERSVKMIADSEEQLANSFLSLHPQEDLFKGLTQYFEKRGWAIIYTPV
jgi:hypothetical protein